MTAPVRFCQFEAAPYHHEKAYPNTGEVIAGFGIWDKIAEDWFIPDGFASENHARIFANRINMAMWRAEDHVDKNWADKPHGLKAGDIRCEICDPTEDHD